MRKTIILASVILVTSGTGYAVYQHNADTSSTKATQKSSQTPVNTSNQLAASFDKQQFSTVNPTSSWVVVNKQHPLRPKNYVPNDLVVPRVPLRVPGNESMQLRQVTATALQDMFTAASKDSISLMLSSGYRSYNYQVSLYNGYVASQGQTVADTQSARPGFSEHQTGLAADVEPASKKCEVEQCFGSTPEGEWVATNAYKYGFIVRYTTGNEDSTGYGPEPWHIRYVGVELATELHRTHTATLEQFFGIKGGKAYN